MPSEQGDAFKYDPKDACKYNPTRFSVEEDLAEPSYTRLLDWAKDAESEALALNIWARVIMSTT
jgi:hypothetical protein